ncbi:aldo/keto reductase [Clostridiaceae bacterium 35-E11]
MLYRKFGPTNEEISVLGFGCMRFPTVDGKDDQIDEEKATEMLRYAIDQGVNYVDTAYPYHGGMSEPFVGRALKNGYREKVHLATKLPSWLIKKREDMDYYLDEQLKRLQTDHIDFYLVHALNQERWNNLKTLNIFEFLDAAIADGRVKYVGFSFHDELPLFKEIVDAYDWTFCQIQYNYLDEAYQAGKEGFEYAASRGLGVIIMEPLLGGKIATNIPKDIQAVWDQATVKKSPVEWALQFLWDNPRTGIVLSGMSDMAQVVENIEIADKALPNTLTDEEKDLIEAVKKIYKSRIKVNCTNCRYCMPCPAGVDIPESFSHFNNAFMFDDMDGAKKQYHNFIKEKKRASKCVTCRKCEEVCPQHIPISDMLKEVVHTFER